MAGTRLFRRGVIDAGRVGPGRRDGLQRGKTLIIPGLRNRVLAFSVRLSPRVLVTRVSGYLQA
jgi:short-subunit dehydrogenase